MKGDASVTVNLLYRHPLALALAMTQDKRKLVAISQAFCRDSIRLGFARLQRLVWDRPLVRSFADPEGL